MEKAEDAREKKLYFIVSYVKYDFIFSHVKYKFFHNIYTRGTALWSLSKTNLSLLSIGSTQKDLSLFN